ncbi:MAG: hypothetical protein LBK66_06955 [Spirochaetaceae bacterium]|nr:hypothetical protein [Spirochaetaceae bacterium]
MRSDVGKHLTAVIESKAAPPPTAQTSLRWLAAAYANAVFVPEGKTLRLLTVC